VSQPEFPDLLGHRSVQRPGALSHKAGLDPVRRIEELERAGVRATRVRTKAGVPSDADFTVAPPNGTMMLDTTNHRLYVRSGGTWRYATLT
jgi:hypothetical protein